MTDDGKKFYHYFMLSIPMQVGCIMVALVLFGIQILIYSAAESHPVVFSGECEVLMGVDIDDEEKMGIIAQCGRDRRDLGTLAEPYLYKLLTEGQAPAILCDKTVSTLLNNVNWSCKLDIEEEA